MLLSMYGCVYIIPPHNYIPSQQIVKVDQREAGTIFGSYMTVYCIQWNFSRIIKDTSINMTVSSVSHSTPLGQIKVF